jgi:hypothetical protein
VLRESHTTVVVLQPLLGYAGTGRSPETNFQPCVRLNSFIKPVKASTAFMVTAL